MIKKILSATFVACLLFLGTVGFQETQAAALDSTKNLLDGFDTKGDYDPSAPDLNPYDDVYSRVQAATGGGLQFNVLLFDIIDLFRWVVTVIAVIFLVLAGARMVAESGNEENAKKQLKVIRDVVIGIILMNLSVAIVQNVFGSVGSTNQFEAVNYTSIGPNFGPILFTYEVVFPLINFFLSFIAAMTILFLVISAFRVITAQGDEEKVKNAFVALRNTVIGLALIILAKMFVQSLFGLPTPTNTSLEPDISQGIAILMQVATFILSFVGIIALVMYIYAGVLIFLGSVTEEKKKKGMKIALYTTVAIMISVIAYGFIYTLVVGSVNFS